MNKLIAHLLMVSLGYICLADITALDEVLVVKAPETPTHRVDQNVSNSPQTPLSPELLSLRNQQIAEAKREFRKYVGLPYDPTKDQEWIQENINYWKQRLIQLNNTAGPIPPSTPPTPPIIQEQELILAGNLGKGLRNVSTEKLTNIILREDRLKRGNSLSGLEKAHSSPAAVRRMAEAICELTDPNKIDE